MWEVGGVYCIRRLIVPVCVQGGCEEKKQRYSEKNLLHKFLNAPTLFT